MRFHGIRCGKNMKIVIATARMSVVSFNNEIIQAQADPCMVAPDGVWKIWMSSGDYAPVSTIPLIP